MIAFHMRLLKGRVRVAVVDLRETVSFRIGLNPGWGTELSAVVRENNGEEPCKHFKSSGIAEPHRKLSEDHGERLRDVGRCFGGQQQRDHETVGHKHQRQEYLATFNTFNRVHFCNGQSGILLDEAEIISVGASDPTLGVDLVLNGFRLAGLECAGARQIMALCVKEPAINVAVDRFLIYGEEVVVADHNGVYGLPLLCKVVESLVEFQDFRLRDVCTAARFYKPFAVVFLRHRVDVEAFAKDAFFLLRTAVAYVGRAREPRADVLHEIIAV